MVEEVFINLSLILIVAVVVSAIARFLRQPILVGYIFAGILVGPYLFNFVDSAEFLQIFSQIGIALLLFMVGLQLNPRVIKEVGWVSLMTGMGQVVFTFSIGFFISRFLGFTNIASLYISLALTFSSTIIIMKLLSDKGDLDTLYGRIAVGFLIVQDFIAILVLMFISSFSGQSDFSLDIVYTLIKGFVAIVFVFGLSWFFVPLVTKFVARSQEFLFLFSIAWCFALASLFQYLNFSIEIGALLAGITLSISPYINEISAKIRPLRDFFIVLFFILLGSQMVLGDVTNHIIPIVIFSLFILIGNPLIVMIIMGLLGYTKRNSFMAGLTVAQISEFSLILIALGISVGHLNSEILSVVTSVGLITIAGSTYMIIYSNTLYNLLSDYLSVFERKGTRDKKMVVKNYESVLFGYNRIGYGILMSLKKIKKSYVVVEHNPDTVENLTKLRIPCIYGDAYDIDFLDDLALAKIKLAVSTIPDFEANSLIVEKVRMVNKKAIVILRAHSVQDALDLYKKGASYVLTPHFLGGQYISKMIEHSEVKSQDYEDEKVKHVAHLKKMLEKGIEHPEVERN